MPFICQSSILTIRGIYVLFSSNVLIKPKIQRKKCWTLKDVDNKGITNNYDFIKFIIKIKNSVNPILFVEKNVNNETVKLVIDGNNRINAILRFILYPLELFTELIHKEFTDEFKKKIKNISLDTILKYRNFGSFCENTLRDSSLLEKNLKKFKNINLDVYDIFQQLQENLNDYDFMNIQIPISIFQNINEKEISEIYESVNQGGIKLTRQEILASSTSFNTYTHTELHMFNQFISEINSWYDISNNNEILKIENTMNSIDYKIENNRMNLFEILLSLQIILHDKYSSNLKLLDPPGKNKALDLIFKLYELIYKDFTTYNSELNKFIEKIINIFELIKKLYINYIFNNTINFSQISTYKSSLTNNSKIIIILKCYYNYEKIINEDKTFINNILKIIVFNEILTTADKDLKKEFNDHCLSYSKTRFLDKYAKDIKENKEEVKAVSDNIFKELFDKIIKLQLNESNSKQSRKCLNKFKIITMSLYFHKCVPQYLHHKKKNNEHIIPFSSDKNNNCIDLDRLGNLILIDEQTNQKKSDKIIDNEFIKKYNLHYYNYPDDKVYKEIISLDKKILSKEKFNTMCIERENKYINEILKLLL